MRNSIRATLAICLLIGVAVLMAVALPVAPARAANLVLNGGFESGDFTGWTAVYTGVDPLDPWAVSGPGFWGWFGFSPPSGTYFAWNGFDGDGPSEFYLYQDVTLPADKVSTLSFMYRFEWDFTVYEIPATTPRQLIVQLRDPATNSVLATLYSASTGTFINNPTGDTGWVTVSRDLSAFAGSTVRLYFLEVIPELYTGPATIGFDDISITEGAPLVFACDVADGSLNAYHCGRPVAIYGVPLEVWGIDPSTGKGELVFEVGGDEIAALEAPAAPMVLAQGVNPFTGQPITLYVLPSGELQLNTYYWDGKPYIVTWPIGSNDPGELYVQAW